jgi:hypothetical protein
MLLLNHLQTPRRQAGFRIKTIEESGCLLTEIRINNKVEVGTEDGWLCFWTAGREIRMGPLTPEQAEKLSEDLGYEALD